MYNEVLSSECMPYVYKGNSMKPIVLSCLNAPRALTQCHVLDFRRLMPTAEDSTSYKNFTRKKKLKLAKGYFETL